MARPMIAALLALWALSACEAGERAGDEGPRDPAVADGQAPDRSPPDRGAGDAGGGEAGAPDAASAQDAAPPAPDAARADAAGPDAAGPVPDAAGPDSAPPDAAGPDSGPPDAAGPDVAGPDSAPPDAAGPDSGPPDAGPPDAAGPDAAAPDAASPELDAAVDPDQGRPADAAVALADRGFACDAPAILAQRGCTGCHGEGLSLAGLDLTAPELASALVDVPATTEACRDRRLINAQQPEQSLLLQVVGLGEPGGDACNLVMPPGRDPRDEAAGLSAAERDCLTAWVQDLIAQAGPVAPVAPFEPTPVASAVIKVKTLLTGLPVTDAEIAAVEADPAALRGLVQAWTATPEHRVKRADFLTLALQQRMQLEDPAQFDDLAVADGERWDLVERVLQESFVRTAMAIADEGRPFTEVLTTRRWMVTTANLVLLRYPDQPTADKTEVRHHLVGDPALAPAEPEGPVWHIPELETFACRIRQIEALDMLMGAINRKRCPKVVDGETIFPPVHPRLEDPPLTDADFADWRWVELVPASEAEGEAPIPFYDLPTLRAADRVVTGLHRVGFFTTSVFLNNWSTNVDNQFRVTINQTLLAALHAGFTVSEPTEPLHLDGLDAAHAGPETTCYGCHRHMDPMRVYFGQTYGYDYQTPTALEAEVFPPELRGGFAFLGATAADGDLSRLAEALAAHPRFPVAWTQKLCLYANARRCDETDPEFERIAARFNEGFDFNGLVVDLFSSPLVTGLAETQTWAQADIDVGITRRNHLCALLNARLRRRPGDEDICSVGRVKEVAGLIPEDAVARGEADFVQPNLPSTFQSAAAEAVCEAAARWVVRRGIDDPQFPIPGSPAALETTIEALVVDLMGLPPGHPRYEPAKAMLRAHYAEALATEGVGLGVPAIEALFLLACMSPDVQGVGL